MRSTKYRVLLLDRQGAENVEAWRGFIQTNADTIWSRAGARGWANSSHFYLYSDRNLWANLHFLGQPNTSLVAMRESHSLHAGHAARRWPTAGGAPDLRRL